MCDCVLFCVFVVGGWICVGNCCRCGVGCDLWSVIYGVVYCDCNFVEVWCGDGDEVEGGEGLWYEEGDWGVFYVWVEMFDYWGFGDEWGVGVGNGGVFGGGWFEGDGCCCVDW